MSESPQRSWTGLPATFWALFAGVLVMALATFVFPFLALFLRSRGYSVEQTGLLVALFGAGSIPAGPLAGWLSDRFGRRPTLLGSLASAAALTALLPLFTGSTALAVAGTLALGLAVHAYYPASSAVVSDVVPPARYGDAFGLMYWERNLGIAVSFALGGTLVRFGYERLFLADAATTLLFALVVFWKVPETRPRASTPHPDAPAAPARGWGAVLADRPFFLLMLIQTVFSIGLFQFMVALPVIMEGKGLSPGEYGYAMAVNGALIALLSPFVGRATQRHDPGNVLALAALFVAAGYGAYAWCDSTVEYAGATAVWTIGEILTMPVISALVAALSPEDLRGRYQGLFSLSFGISLALAPAVGGIAVGRLGDRLLWALVAAVSVLVAAAHLAAGRARRRTRPVPSPAEA